MTAAGSLARLPTRKVLFILGWGRSGTTILDNILGEADGLFSVGELAYIWRRGLLGGGRCGSGDLIRECEVWSKVVQSAFGEHWARTLPVEEIVRWYERAIRARYTTQLLRKSPQDVISSSPLGRYLGLLGRLYDGIARVTGARVIVDSSKRPCDGALLHLVPNVSPYFVHMVRDPRAVAHSWGRARAWDPRNPRVLMTPHSPSYSTTHWLTWNAWSDAIRRAWPSRSILVRYEDFARSPREWVGKILALVGEDPEMAAFVDDHTVHLHGNHTVSGNPSRFASGTVTIRDDDEWITGQPIRHRLVSTALALPYLNRYRYPIWPKRRARNARRRESFSSSPPARPDDQAT